MSFNNVLNASNLIKIAFRVKRFFIFFKLGVSGDACREQR